MKWSTGDAHVATINATGLATAVAPCSNVGSGRETTIAAVMPGSEISTTATFAVGQCGTRRDAPALTIHAIGEGSGKVVSDPAAINCGGDEGCTGNFSLNAPVNLTATPNPGSVFGGLWASCVPVVPDPSGCAENLRGSNVKSCTCATTVVNSGAVGAIFNTAR